LFHFLLQRKLDVAYERGVAHAKRPREVAQIPGIRTTVSQYSHLAAEHRRRRARVEDRLVRPKEPRHREMKGFLQARDERRYKCLILLIGSPHWTVSATTSSVRRERSRVKSRARCGSYKPPGTSTATARYSRWTTVRSDQMYERKFCSHFKFSVGTRSPTRSVPNGDPAPLKRGHESGRAGGDTPGGFGPPPDAFVLRRCPPSAAHVAERTTPVAVSSRPGGQELYTAVEVHAVKR
jgi:hypothetical protein